MFYKRNTIIKVKLAYRTGNIVSQQSERPVIMAKCLEYFGYSCGILYNIEQKYFCQHAGKLRDSFLKIKKKVEIDSCYFYLIYDSSMIK